MNFLIVGGFFAIALAALIALVFVLRTDTRTNAAPQPPRQEREESESTTRQSEKEPSLAAQAIPNPVEGSMLKTQERDQPFPPLNGQFHELAIEMHNLHLQAKDLEERLDHLVALVEHIEHSQGSYANGLEEVSRRAIPPHEL